MKLAIKKTQKEDEICNAARLYEVKTLIKELEKEEKEIKGHFKTHMITNKLKIYQVGEFMMSIKITNKSKLDKEAIIAKHGKDFFKEYTSINEVNNFYIDNIEAK